MDAASERDRSHHTTHPYFPRRSTSESNQRPKTPLHTISRFFMLGNDRASPATPSSDIFVAASRSIWSTCSAVLWNTLERPLQ
jgi:hypothetical protein